MIIFFSIVFPGMLFSVFSGLIIGWLERKISAKIQHRIGPPWYQNILDIFKLLGKETIIPGDSNAAMYILAPVVSFSSIIAFSTITGSAVFLGIDLAGDIILLIYLLAMGSASIFLGAAASGNIYASIGGGRELKMLLADEIVFIMVILVPVIKSGFQFRLTSIMQQSPLLSVSGTIAFIVGILCIQAKIALQPFDLPEAETELAGGVEIEYSGVLLGLWKLSKGVQIFGIPLLLSSLFFGVPDGFSPIRYLWAAGFYLVTIVILILIKNVNPRITIDAMLKFFWRILTPIMLFTVILALLGG